MNKPRIFFRVFPFNILSYPTLLHAWERNDIDREFEIIILSGRDPLKRIKFNKDDVLLYSAMTPFLPQVHGEILSIKKSSAADVNGAGSPLIAAGGPHVNGEQDLAFAIGCDILFAGHAEDNFLRFAHDLLDNKIARAAHGEIERKIYRNNPENAGSDLNKYLPISKYFKTVPPLEIMRGCLWRCKYCGTRQPGVSFRELDSIDLYLDELKEKKLKRVNFIAPSALEYGANKRKTIRLDKIEEILETCRSYGFEFIEYGIFPSEIRPDTVTAEAMRILKKYVANRAITIGAQSGADSRLKELARGHDTAAIENAVEIANACGFSANLDFIVGCPGENKEDRSAAIDFIKKLSAQYHIKVQLHFFFPLPGSGYAYRFPSFLDRQEKERLVELKKNGIARDGWVENEKQVRRYFKWLKRYFPAVFSRYY